MTNKYALIAGASALALAAVAGAQVATTKSVQPVPITASTPKSSTNTGTGAGGMTQMFAALAVKSAASAPAAVAAPTAPPLPVLKTLPPLNLSDMWLWNWNGKWMASEWGNGNSPLAWRYDHVKQPAAKDTLFTLDATGAPELQALNGTTAYGRGLWESEVTLPQLRDGLVVAPLWIYDSGSRDEIDFELAGRRGLDVTMHVYVNGVHQQNTVRLFAGTDMSGQRHRFGIKTDEAGGYVEMYLDGKLVQRWDRNKMTYFVAHPMKPFIEMWAASPTNAGFVQWVGKWGGLAANDKLTMTVHGYDFTPIG